MAKNYDEIRKGTPSFVGFDEFWNSFRSGVSNFWKKITGSGLTGAEREANEWSARQAELAFEREAEFYEKNQSMAAQIAAQREAGINPFGINGSASAGPVVSSSAPSSVTPTGSQGFDPIALAMQIARFRLDKETADAQNAKTAAETKQIGQEMSWYDQLTSVKLDEMRSSIKKNEAEVNKSLQDIKESVSRISVNNSTIEVNGARIQFMGSQEELNATQAAVNKLTAAQVEKLMPYIQARQEAEIAYTNAKTSEAKYNAEKSMYDANMSMLGVMRESDLIDKGYYDNLVMKSEFEAVNEKRDYHWKPINDVCSNLSKLAIGIGSAVGGAAAWKGVPAPTPPATPAPVMNFF